FALYTSLYYRFRGLARRLKSNYDAMVIYTLGFYILFQMMIHVYVSTGLAPSTGLTLPFISKGGSSLMAMSVAVGIILSYNKADKMVADTVEADEFIEESIKATDDKLQERANEALEADLRNIENIEKNNNDEEQA
ncbi:MAG: FtsW/RodA/SpoVE family cell cycle protein, partial [Rikenellaceae bacterium]